MFTMMEKEDAKKAKQYKQLKVFCHWCSLTQQNCTTSTDSQTFKKANTTINNIAIARTVVSSLLIGQLRVILQPQMACTKNQLGAVHKFTPQIDKTSSTTKVGTTSALLNLQSTTE
jgi:hypothetical protein